MFKIIAFLLIAVSPITAQAQQGKIIYDLPKSVTQKFEEKIDNYEKQRGKSEFAIELSSLGDHSYFANLILGDSFKDDSSDVVYNTLIKKTNRFARVGNKLLPIITEEDFLFADFGSIKTPNSGSPRRQEGKIKVVFTSEFYSLTFDKNGRIISD